MQMTVEERQTSRRRQTELKKMFEENCHCPPSSTLQKKLQKYKVMPDEYYFYEQSKYMDLEKLASINEMRAAGFEPGVSSTMRELMAGSGRLSATAREEGMTHQPPVDYRWGVNLGHWWHQVIICWQLFVYPVDVLWASPTCTPWGSNARQWPEEQRSKQRQQESLTLQFLTVLFFIQMVLGRVWMLEQPAGSDLFRASALQVLTGADALDQVFPWVFDQCMLGAQVGGQAVKKRTQISSNSKFHSDPPQCDGSHTHCVLRGCDYTGSRTAQAAVYPPEMCRKILQEIRATSADICHGGRAAEVHLERLRDYGQQVHALQKILPEVRLLAQHRGEDWLRVFDAVVAPWAAQTLGGELDRLQYDAHLTKMHVISLPEVHGKNAKRSLHLTSQTGCAPEARVGPPTHSPVATDPEQNPGNYNNNLERIERDLAEIKANMLRNFGNIATEKSDMFPQLDFEEVPVVVAGTVTYGGSSSSGSGGVAPRAADGDQPPPAAPQDPELEIPWMQGDGRAEGQHVRPVTMSETLKGKLEAEPWQFQPYKSGDATWLHAAQRRHAHRRRPNATIGVASVDVSGPHVATPMPGMRIGSRGGRYFVVMVVRPDLTGGRKDAACQHEPPPAAGAAPVAHEATGDPAPADAARGGRGPPGPPAGDLHAAE